MDRVVVLKKERTLQLLNHGKVIATYPKSLERFRREAPHGAYVWRRSPGVRSGRERGRKWDGVLAEAADEQRLALGAIKTCHINRGLTFSRRA